MLTFKLNMKKKQKNTDFSKSVISSHQTLVGKVHLQKCHFHNSEWNKDLDISQTEQLHTTLWTQRRTTQQILTKTAQNSDVKPVSVCEKSYSTVIFFFSPNTKLTLLKSTHDKSRRLTHSDLKCSIALSRESTVNKHQLTHQAALRASRDFFCF